LECWVANEVSAGAQRQSPFHLRSALLLIALFCFLAHGLVLASLGPKTPGPLLSETLQFTLGVAALLAMVDASRRSSHFARRIWAVSAAAIGIYTAGQGILVYYMANHASPAHYRITSEFFFFWFAPLLVAAVIDPSGLTEVFDWDLVLDLSQFLILALALHLLLMGNSLEWQTRFRETDLRDWETRIVRDVVVLSVLAGRAFFSRYPQVRSLFRRLGIFYLSYSLVGGIYKYAEAIQQPTSGTWLDLGWSIPRLLAVVVAVTWVRTDDIAGAELSARGDSVSFIYRRS
jgi:hypothetical protein